MEQHQDNKQLPCAVMKLPEKPAIGNKRCDLLHILKHIPHWPVVKTKTTPEARQRIRADSPSRGMYDEILFVIFPVSGIILNQI